MDTVQCWREVERDDWIQEVKGLAKEKMCIPQGHGGQLFGEGQGKVEVGKVGGGG